MRQIEKPGVGVQNTNVFPEDVPIDLLSGGYLLSHRLERELRGSILAYYQRHNQTPTLILFHRLVIQQLYNHEGTQVRFPITDRDPSMMVETHLRFFGFFEGIPILSFESSQEKVLFYLV